MSPYREALAVVTGAASGIGRCLAQQLAEAGARVMLTDLNADAVEQVARQIRERGSGSGGWPRARAFDVSDREAFAEAIEQLTDEHGPVDYLFNNAGIGVGGEARDLAPEDWTRVLDVNLRGVIHGVDAVYPAMVRRGRGHIINVASVAGLTPLPGEISYVASKYAVVGLTQTLRAEAADLGVRVTLVCPGKIETPIYRTSKIVGFDKQGVLSLWPRGITPEACARRILRGVERNEGIIVVTAFAKALWAMSRLSPSLTQWSMRQYLRRVRRFRTLR